MDQRVLSLLGSQLENVLFSSVYTIKRSELTKHTELELGCNIELYSGNFYTVHIVGQHDRFYTNGFHQQPSETKFQCKQCDSAADFNMFFSIGFR